MLFARTAERIDAIRPNVAASLFDDATEQGLEVEGEMEVSDEFEVSDEEVVEDESEE